MFKSCKYCGRIHKMNEECPQKPKRKSAPKIASQQNSIRGSALYQSIRNDVVERDHHICRVCFLQHFKVNSYRLEVHHITPIEEDPSRAYDENNLITLCREHHELAEAGLIAREKLYQLVRQSYSDVLYMTQKDFEGVVNGKGKKGKP